MPPTRIEAELAAFGAFFAVDMHDTGATPALPWRPMGELVSDGGALRARVQAVRDTLARNAGVRTEAVEARVAASTAHFGLVARILAPAVAADALAGRRLGARIDQLWWQDRLGAPFPLSAIDHGGDEHPQLVDSAVEAITRAVGHEFTVSAKVLWGNVGSAVNSAAQLVTGIRPDLGARAHGAADALLADLRIEGGRRRSGPAFRRRSCCLIYRLAADTSAACRDCVLIGRR